MSSSNGGNNATGGVSLASLVFLLFLGLKLTHYIDWDWVWVCSPLWIPFLATLVILFGVFLFAAIAAAIGFAVSSVADRPKKPKRDPNVPDLRKGRF